MVVEYVVKLLALKNEDGTQKLFNRNIGIGKKHTLDFFYYSLLWLAAFKLLHMCNFNVFIWQRWRSN